jgi:hypothetical protein
LGLNQAWNTLEVGVFGSGNGIEANFGPPNSTSLEVSVFIGATNGATPQCVKGAETGESNNLNLICCNSGLGEITALESNVPGVTPAACQAPTNPWIELPGGGCASNIAAADGDYPWITGCTPGRNTIWYWTGNSTLGAYGGWVLTNGAAENIAAFNNPVDGYLNYPAVVGTNGKVYLGSPYGSDIGSNAGSSVDWIENPNGSGSGTSISSSPGFVDGNPNWTNYISGGSDVLYYSTLYGSWSEVGSPMGIAEWISVAPDDSSLWALTSAGGLYMFSGTLNPEPTSSPWVYQLGNVSQVAAGPGGSYAYIQGNTLWFLQQAGGIPQAIASGGNGQPSWANQGAWGTQLGIGANGNVWVIDESGNIWEYVPQSRLF